MRTDPPPAPWATIIAHYPRDRGTLTLRGSAASLDWNRDLKPDRVDGDTSTFHVSVPHGECVEAKLVRSDGAWMVGVNVVIGAGETRNLRPAFDSPDGKLCAPETIEVPGAAPLRIRVMLPPTYGEQPSLRYPVIYAQDAQSLWSDGADPFGLWNLDRVLDALWDVRALEDLIVVSIDTSEQRLDRLSPIADPEHGGGHSAAHLEAIVSVLKPTIDRTLRTRPDRESTALLGSSMGGLFSFWAAWTRPDVFGAAMCLSPSFWWADRWALRHVSRAICPAPRPNLYLDSGAAASEHESEGGTRDGMHHTRAMYRALVAHCYEPGHDIHVLAFTGAKHDASSWAARIAVPLQIVFPRPL
jgi:predicted alpha/beta superfamily hydrolase